MNKMLHGIAALLALIIIVCEAVPAFAYNIRNIKNVKELGIDQMSLHQMILSLHQMILSMDRQVVEIEDESDKDYLDSLQPDFSARNTPNNNPDIPNFLNFGDDIGFEEENPSHDYRYYSYFCDVTSNQDTAERFVAELINSNKFVLVGHESNDGSRVGNRRIGRVARGSGYALTEHWYLRYTGSKNVQPFQTGRRDNKYLCNLAVLTTRDLGSGTTSFKILFSYGLTYGTSTYASGGNQARYSSSSSSSSQHKTTQIRCSRCNASGKIKCSACDGKGGRYEYRSVPNYSGSKKGSHTSRTWQRCDKCNGTGNMTCPDCGGDRYITRQLY